jgi:hypothetical protein
MDFCDLTFSTIKQCFLYLVVKPAVKFRSGISAVIELDMNMKDFPS